MNSTLDIAAPFSAMMSVCVALLSVAMPFVGPQVHPVEGTAVYEGTVRPGQFVLVEWSITKRTECIGMNARVWDGENTFHLTEPAMPNSLPVSNDPITATIPTRIPEYAPPGKLTLRIVGSCEVDGMKPLPFVLGPIEFEVYSQASTP